MLLAGAALAQSAFGIATLLFRDIRPMIEGGNVAAALALAVAMGRAHAAEIGVAMVPFREMVYIQELDAYVPDDEVPAGRTVLSLAPDGLEGRAWRAAGGTRPSGSLSTTTSAADRRQPT